MKTLLVLPPGKYSTPLNIREDNCYMNKLLCPFCFSIEDGREDEGLQIDDYVSHPMLWCNNCEVRAVLLEETLTKISLEEAKEQFPKVAERLENLVNPPKEENDNEQETDESEDEDSEYKTELVHEPYNNFYTIDCALTTRVANIQLYEYQVEELKCPYNILPRVLVNIVNEYITITEKEVREFVEMQSAPYWGKCYYYNNNLSEEKKESLTKEYELRDEEEYEKRFKTFCENFRITKRDEPGDEDTEDLWTLSLPVDSYNIVEPKVPYPLGINLSHDSITIYLKCVNSKGEEFVALYWGD